MKDCGEQRLQTTVSINLWKIFAGDTGDWFDVKTASMCTTELWNALNSFILNSLKIKVAPDPVIVSPDTLSFSRGLFGPVEKPMHVQVIAFVRKKITADYGPVSPSRRVSIQTTAAVFYGARKVRFHSSMQRGGSDSFSLPPYRQ